MSKHDVYHKAVTELTKAGFKPIRNGRREIWQNADKSKGVALSYNIRDKRLAQSLLRSAGVIVRL